MAERYFITLGDGPEREITKAEYVVAERAAGFLNWKGNDNDPATSSFDVGGVKGRIEYVRGEAMRKFQVYGDIYGDRRVYVNERGNWRLAGIVPWDYGDHGTETTARANLGITDLTEQERVQLTQELLNPRGL